jgi:hypothetical protein
MKNRAMRERCAKVMMIKNQSRSALVFRLLGLSVRGAHDGTLENSGRNIDCMLAVLHLTGAILFLAMRPA